ncbi:hypothetical protein [Actinokineospora fastidiosa]|uniref:Uncharacterized protein n=1 Tax=Actinokineospora fastidiosa TaxID=1816 RepID=A0A918GUC1_9PSEU|nr:hypothetical protein [Actinokineospora fastidiosa]GGS61381.1 hypothetical protein GCM10010171_65230 [Actinokineospora fastidiosa]
MAKERFIMHIEAERHWWRGVSTTLCGLTFKVEQSSIFGLHLNPECPTCKRLAKQRKQDKKAARKGGRR